MARPGAEANVDGRSDDPRSHQLKDALHRSQAHADRLRQPPACPMLASRGGGPSARSITRCTVTAGNGGCRAAAIDRRQDDFGAPNMLLRRVVIADNKTAIGVTFTTIPALMTRA